MRFYISISDCSSDEFRCNDGKCISIREQCDGEVNCYPNGEDEENCGKYQWWEKQILSKKLKKYLHLHHQIFLSIAQNQMKM